MTILATLFLAGALLLAFLPVLIVFGCLVAAALYVVAFTVEFFSGMFGG